MPVAIEHEKCDVCAKCIDVCATEALKKEPNADGKEQITVVDENCADCGICISECPTQSITQV